MTPEMLQRHLTHHVDVSQVIGTNTAGEDTLQVVKRIRCLVDQSSGRRLVFSQTSVDLTYDYTITFYPDLVIKPDMILEDARDNNDDLIFTNAQVVSVHVYRHPIWGVIAYLARVSCNDTEP